MKKVIVGVARSGTTCAYETLLQGKKYIDIDTVQYGKKSTAEWLNPIFYSKEQILDNILFLVEEKTYGKEYTWKALINQIRPYIKWFKSFYSPEEVYVIKRRNIWNHYISTMYQESINFDDAYVTDIHRKYKPMVYDDYVRKTNRFFNNINDLDNFNHGEVLYYEDHDWGNKSKILSDLVDYEKHFINFEEIKKHFNAQYSMYKQTV